MRENERQRETVREADFKSWFFENMKKVGKPPAICFKIYLFIYLIYLAAFCLRCCARAFCSCGEWRLLFVAVRRLLIAVASPIVEHGL